MVRSLASVSLILALVSSGCASAPKDDQKAAPSDKSSDAEKSAQDSLKPAQLERQRAIERNKVARARMDVEANRRSDAAALEKAKAELAQAEQARKRFGEEEAPIKTERAQLDLQEAQDSLAENREELDQLEMMYKADDLADKTKEIVLNRGKRRLERAQQRLALQQREANSLQSELDQTRAKLELAVTEKKVELERMQRSVESDALEKDTAVLSAQAELARVEEELAQLSAKSGAAPRT
jgi:hypothetical protein